MKPVSYIHICYHVLQWMLCSVNAKDAEMSYVTIALTHGDDENTWTVMTGNCTFTEQIVKSGEERKLKSSDKAGRKVRYGKSDEEDEKKDRDDEEDERKDRDHEDEKGDKNEQDDEKTKDKGVVPAIANYSCQSYNGPDWTPYYESEVTFTVPHGIHRYYLFKEKTAKTWDDAKRKCESEGGYLAVVQSELEMFILLQFMMNRWPKGQVIRYAWIGMEKKGSKWKDIFGDDITYFDWGYKQPDGKKGETCGAVLVANDRINMQDVVCNDGTAFLCEEGF